MLEEEKKTLYAFEDQVEELTDRREWDLWWDWCRLRQKEVHYEERKTTLEVLADISFVVKGLVEIQKENIPSTETQVLESRVKLPKIEVPTFDGNALGWNQFWNSSKYPRILRPKLVMLKSSLTFDRPLRTAT